MRAVESSDKVDSVLCANKNFLLTYLVILHVCLSPLSCTVLGMVQLLQSNLQNRHCISSVVFLAIECHLSCLHHASVNHSAHIPQRLWLSLPDALLPHEQLC